MFFAPAVFAPSVRSNRYVPRAFDRSFERFVGDALFGAQRAVQFAQDDTSWTLSLDVPGLSREDLDVQIDGQVVRIESKADAKRSFRAAYQLPQDIEAAASQARLENGVLTLKLGKRVPVDTSTVLRIE